MYIVFGIKYILHCTQVNLVNNDYMMDLLKVFEKKTNKKLYYICINMVKNKTIADKTLINIL